MSASCHLPVDSFRETSRSQIVASVTVRISGRLSLYFRPGKSNGLDAAYHFRFTGSEQADATVTIRGRKLTVAEGLNGRPELRITADSTIWVKFLNVEMSIVRALANRKIRLNGSPKLLAAFGRCFPN